MSEEKVKAPDIILLDHKTKQLILELNMEVIDKQTRIKQILQTYLNALRADGTYSLSPDFSTLVKDRREANE